ncbi:thiol-disulfide isomerase/thioredoxin [Flavobacterium sp. 5]|nr:thiol-disulfide isomerase/thioredoxin [Flavobacterium sp. 5]
MKKIMFLVPVVLFFFSANAQTMNLIKFTARIENRNSDTLIIRQNNFKQIIPINKNEVFEATFEAPTGFYLLYYGTDALGLYLKPDSEVNLTLNSKQFAETIVFKGKGSKENNFLAQQVLKNKKFEEEAFLKEPTEFASLLEVKKKNDLEGLEKGDYDPEFKERLKGNFDVYSINAVNDYARVTKMNKLKEKLSPDFDYENYKGGKTRLSDLKGKYVYIDIWATWCGPCKAEIPFLKKIEKKYHGKNIEFVSISIDEKNEKWKKFVLDKNLGGIQLIADKEWESEFVQSYGVVGIPRFILLDPIGNVLEADADRPSSDNLQTKFDALLE